MISRSCALAGGGDTRNGQHTTALSTSSSTRSFASFVARRRLMAVPVHTRQTACVTAFMGRGARAVLYDDSGAYDVVMRLDALGVLLQEPSPPAPMACCEFDEDANLAVVDEEDPSAASAFHKHVCMFRSLRSTLLRWPDIAAASVEYYDPTGSMEDSDMEETPPEGDSSVQLEAATDHHQDARRGVVEERTPTSYVCLEMQDGAVLLLRPVRLLEVQRSTSPAESHKIDNMCLGGVDGVDGAAALKAALSGESWADIVNAHVERSRRHQRGGVCNETANSSNSATIEQLRSVLERKRALLQRLAEEVTRLDSGEEAAGMHDDEFRRSDGVSALGTQVMYNNRPRTAGGVLLPTSAQLADSALAALPDSPASSPSYSASSTSSMPNHAVSPGAQPAALSEAAREIPEARSLDVEGRGASAEAAAMLGASMDSIFFSALHHAVHNPPATNDANTSVISAQDVSPIRSTSPIVSRSNDRNHAAEDPLTGSYEPQESVRSPPTSSTLRDVGRQHHRQQPPTRSAPRYAHSCGVDSVVHSAPPRRGRGNTGITAATLHFDPVDSREVMGRDVAAQRSRRHLVAPSPSLLHDRAESRQLGMGLLDAAPQRRSEVLHDPVLLQTYDDIHGSSSEES